MIKYFTIEDLLKHYLQKKFHILKSSDTMEDMPIDQKPTDFSNLQNKLTSQHKKLLDVM